VRLAGNFFLALLTFFAYARASFSLRLPPAALEHCPLPLAMRDFYGRGSPIQ
jgi:hypothetical protein